jgi:hypothetical protein
VLPDIFADNVAYFHCFMRAMPVVAAAAGVGGDDDGDGDGNHSFERMAFAKLSACVAGTCPCVLHSSIVFRVLHL